MQEYTDTIAKLENDYVKNETEIAEYKNELAAYQTILQTLKRMAKGISSNNTFRLFSGKQNGNTMYFHCRFQKLFHSGPYMFSMGT